MPALAPGNPTLIAAPGFDCAGCWAKPPLTPTPGVPGPPAPDPPGLGFLPPVAPVDQAPAPPPPNAVNAPNTEFCPLFPAPTV